MEGVVKHKYEVNKENCSKILLASKIDQIFLAILNWKFLVVNLRDLFYDCILILIYTISEPLASYLFGLSPISATASAASFISAAALTNAAFLKVKIQYPKAQFSAADSPNIIQ